MSSGTEFQTKVADKLRELKFVELSGEEWRNCQNKPSRCFTAQFVSGRGLYRERRVDFRVKLDDCEFDVEAKFQDSSGTADQLAWVALKVADRNEFPLFLVIGGRILVNECLPELEAAAKESSYVLGVGTLEDFAAWLSRPGH